MTHDLILENQLKQYLREQSFQPQDRLPSERFLSEKFGIQRLTLRTALQRLKNQGILNVRKNSGYYIADSKIVIELGKPKSHFDSRPEQMQRTLPLNLFKTEFDPSTQHKFPFSDSAGYCLIGLQTSQQIPYAVITSFIPASCIPVMTLAEIQQQELFTLYEQNNQKITHAKEQISSCMASEVESFLLGVPAGSPLVFHHVYGYNIKEQCVLIQKIVYISEKVEFRGW